MALTISQFATGSTTTAVTSIDISSLTAAVGDMLIVAVASDNSATGGASPISSVTDSASNTYTSRVDANRDPGAANEGVSLRVFTSVLTSALSSGTVTANFNTSTSNANVLIWRVQAAAGETFTAVSGQTYTGAGTTVSIGSTANTQIPDTVFTFIATEAGGAFTADTDTVAGTWSSMYTEATAAETPIASQYKTVTVGGLVKNDTSWASTADYAGAYIFVRLTQTAKLYLPSTSSAPAISPSVDAGWDKSSDVDRLIAAKTKASSAFASVTATKTVNNTAYDIVRRQYIYGPLAAQTINGSVGGFIRVSQSSANALANMQMGMRVIASDGSTVRGIVLALSGDALTNGFNTSLSSRQFPNKVETLTSVDAQTGDYLVIEIGTRSREAATTSRTFTWEFGDNSATDHSLNGDSTQYNPVLLFYGSTLALATICTPGTASLSLTAYAPTATATGGGSTDTTVTPGAASLTTTRFAPTATATDNKTATVGVASLTTTRYAPTATATANQTVTPAAASLSATPYAPEATATANAAVEPAAATLTATPDAPTVSATASQTATPGEAALTLSTFAPTASATANQSVTPGAASAALAAFSPDVASTANLSLEAGTLSAALTAHSPAVSTSDAKVSAPATAALALSADAPSVTATANVVVTPAAASLATTRHAPTTAATANRTATPATATIATTTTKPSLALTIDVATASLTATPEAPTRIDGTRRTPASRPLSLTAHAPAVSYTANAVITPQAAALAFVALAPLVINAAPIPATATSRLSATGSATQTLTAPEASLTLVPTAEASLTLSTGGPL